MKTTLTEKQKEQIGAEIDNQGLGYWVLNYGTFQGEDVELTKLIKEAKESLSKLNEYLYDNEIAF